MTGALVASIVAPKASSDIPFAIFAMVFAVAGDTISTSACSANAT